LLKGFGYLFEIYQMFFLRVLLYQGINNKHEDNNFDYEKYFHFLIPSIHNFQIDNFGFRFLEILVSMKPE